MVGVTHLVVTVKVIATGKGMHLNNSLYKYRSPNVCVCAFVCFYYLLATCLFVHVCVCACVWVCVCRWVVGCVGVWVVGWVGGLDRVNNSSPCFMTCTFHRALGMQLSMSVFTVCVYQLKSI